MHTNMQECTKFLTSGFLFKAASNSFKSSGGDLWSVSAPRIEIGTLTPEKCSIVNVSTNTKLLKSSTYL